MVGNISVALLALLISCKQQSSQGSETALAVLEDSIGLSFRSFVEDGWNNKDIEQFKAISVKDFVRNLNGISVATNQSEMQANMNLFFTGFPDARVVVEPPIIKDNRLFAHWTFTGTNTGTFGESPPTGKKVIVNGYSTIQFNNKGKMVQEDVYYNELEFLQQLGYTLTPPITK